VFGSAELHYLSDSLEQRINERRNSRSGSKNYQPAEQNQPDNNWKKPKFLSLFHKRPQIHQEITHWIPPEIISLPRGNGMPDERAEMPKQDCATVYNEKERLVLSFKMRCRSRLASKPVAIEVGP